MIAFLMGNTGEATTLVRAALETTSQSGDDQIRVLHVDGSASFKNAETLKLVRQRVFTAGVRLAAILEEVFK